MQASPCFKESKSAIDLVKDVISKETSGLQSLLDSIDNKYQNAIDLLINCTGRVIICGIGKSGHIARKIAATLSSTGTPALFVHASEASHGDLGMITEDDIVLMISNSGESNELFSVLDYCKRFSIPLIAITKNENSTLGAAADVVLKLPNVPEASNINAPTTSTTVTLALGDALAVALHDLKGFTRQDFQVFHPGGNLGAQLKKVGDIMHKADDLPLASEDATLIDCVVEMSKKRLGCIGITDQQQKLIGIFTDGDLRRNIEKDLRKTQIREIMTKNPVQISLCMLASEALAIMNKKSITSIFITEDGKPVGILHMHDLLKLKVA